LDNININPNTNNLKQMIIIKPILMAFLTSNAVKELVISLLEAYANSTDNTIDDQAVLLIKKNLFPGLKE
tara:strand:+ start:512 stop:721 length:210 start_codon:yes stop_codon:yes gene_type:complete